MRPLFVFVRGPGLRFPPPPQSRSPGATHLDHHVPADGIFPPGARFGGVCRHPGTWPIRPMCSSPERCEHRCLPPSPREQEVGAALEAVAIQEGKSGAVKLQCQVLIISTLAGRVAGQYDSGKYCNLRPTANNSRNKARMYMKTKGRVKKIAGRGSARHGRRALGQPTWLPEGGHRAAL